MDIQKMKAELTLDEGKKLKPYKCTAGKLTIGVGRNLEDVGITHEEADYLLENDIARCLLSLRRALPWFDKLDEVRQRVLVNMTFNLGLTKLLGFKQTLAFIKSGQYQKASEEMLKSAWARQVGDRADRLSKMMKLGVA